MMKIGELEMLQSAFQIKVKMKMKNTSIITNVDSYKVSMYNQYPPGTKSVYSYIEARKGGNLLFFGLQAYLKEYLSKPITMSDIDYAEKLWKAHGEPFNRENWEYILYEYDGYLPLIVKALPEGHIYPEKTVLVTVENTDPKCFWLTTWVETSMLRAVWYGSTVASNSKKIKNVIQEYIEKTSMNPESIAFKLNDFGFRGVSSYESAGIGGAAHLINFAGTDNMAGVQFAMEYYDSGVCGYSIPAMEHSTVSAWGKENEANAYRNMLKQYGDGMLLACVSDAYDIYNACDNIWGKELKDEVMSCNATVVIRPDSGDPVEVCLNVVEILAKNFGYTVNEKGYKTLNKARIIQGDGVNINSITAILDTFETNGWSADNIVFGMGGALLQSVSRDDYSFAMKCSSVNIDGFDMDVFKSPVTDLGKKSKSGRFDDGCSDIVFLNGKIMRTFTFNEIRDNSNK